jgi:hypothetical protein
LVDRENDLLKEDGELDETHYVGGKQERLIDPPP